MLAWLRLGDDESVESHAGGAALVGNGDQGHVAALQRVVRGRPQQPAVGVQGQIVLAADGGEVIRAIVPANQVRLSRGEDQVELAVQNAEDAVGAGSTDEESVKVVLVHVAADDAIAVVAVLGSLELRRLDVDRHVFERVEGLSPHQVILLCLDDVGPIQVAGASERSLRRLPSTARIVEIVAQQNVRGRRFL